MRCCLFAIGLYALLQIALSTAFGDDWPQWMGPGRDDIWRESGIVDRFPAGGPKIAWRVPISGGYSGPAVAEGRVFVTDYVRVAGEAKNDFNARSELTGK